MIRGGTAGRLAAALGLALLAVAPAAPAQPPPPATTAPAVVAPAAPASAAGSAAAAGPAAAPSASTATGALPPPVDPRLAAASELESRVRALLAGSLAVDVAPDALFDVDLDDEEAVAVEARRLRAVVDETAGPPPSAAGVTSGPAPPASAPAGVLPSAADALWRARLAVDRARLAFLELDADERRALLDAHAARRAAADAEQPALAAQREAQRQAERAAEEAAAERRRALEEMEAARTEALRLVAKERARLLGVREAQSNFDATLLGADEMLTARGENVLALRRRVAELLETDGPRRGEEASALYDELRGVLRASRAELAASLGELGSDASDVPRPGPDPLGELAVDRSDLDRLRAELRSRADELAARERASRWARARHFHDVVAALNRDRHALYAVLPPARRAALTGFSADGRDQARGEVDQVRLVVGFHVAMASRLVAASTPGSVAAGLVSSAGLKILILLAAYLWWRRAAQRQLERWSSRDVAPTTTLGARLDRWRDRLLVVALRVHRPLATLLLLRLVLGVLGPGVSDLLEVRLVWIVLRWSLGGLVVIHAIDGLLARRRGTGAPRDAAPVLRLRSLRLVGLVAVIFALILDLSAEIVGRGTLYAWVLRTCWLALVPVVVVLVRWWRPTIFERIGHRTKQSPVARWVAARPSGALGFVAAAVGGAYLLAVGVGRAARVQMGAFDATRRVLAYLFRREVSRTARPHESGTRPLDAQAHAALDPDAACARPSPGVGDEELERMKSSVEQAGGGVFAVVGERGSGKSTLARRLADAKTGTVVVRCPPGGLAGLRPRLLEGLGLAGDATDDDVVTHLREAGAHQAIVVDDAQRLVLPAVGGLAQLDSIVALARASSSQCTWIFCFGAVMWQFIERARGVRPLFDDVLRTRPWTEEQIGELLRSRCEAAGISPSFRELYDESIVDASERADLVARTEASYYRLLWDASGGNPGVALHFWREALRVADDGAVVVSLFTAPDLRELQRLPADVVFVLRAVLRLERVAPEDVATSTMVALPVVHDAIHFATSRGYVEAREGRYRVTWTWLRAITVFLQRRHLLS